MIIILVRDMTGGIRKHIVSVLESYAPHFENVMLVTNLPMADHGFEQFLDRYPQFDSRIVNLNIRRSPHPLDLWQMYVLYKRLKAMMGPMILHGHGAKGGLLARILGRFMGHATFYTPHGGSVHRMHGSLNNFIYVCVEKFLFYLTDYLVFESKYTMQTYEQHIHSATGATANKFILNYNGVPFHSDGAAKGAGRGEHSPEQTQRSVEHVESLAEGSTPSRVRPFVIGAFGALRTIKGYDLLIRAVHLLSKRKIHNVRLKIYGQGEELGNLKALVTGLQLQPQVELGLDTDHVLAAMAECDVVVQPSRFESFGYSTLEAISVHVPVVVAATGGLTEIVQDRVTGRTFPVDDVEALANILSEMIARPEAHQKMADAAYVRAREIFNEQTMVNNIRELYTAAMTRSKK